MKHPALLAISLLLSFWILSSQGALAFPNEPSNGFRDLAWETLSKDVQGLNLVDERRIGGDMITVYTRESDQLSFEGTELDRIRYVFFKGKFFLVYLVATDSRSKYKAIRSALLDKFGQPSAAFPRRDRFYWEGQKVTVSLEYDDFPERTVVSYYYRPLGERIQQAP